MVRNDILLWVQTLSVVNTVELNYIVIYFALNKFRNIQTNLSTFDN